MSYKYIVDHIPTSTPNNRRPRNSMVAMTITIHNTGNEKSTARNERDWLTNPKNNRQASYHIAIDEKEAIECIPTNENAWHAGDGRRDGNMRSIGIEICESGNYAKTIENTIDLVAKMLHERNWGVDRLRRHYDWSKKRCPRLMWDNGTWKTWEQFKQRVQLRLNELSNGKVVSPIPQATQRILRLASPLMNGNDVKELQTNLNKLGFNCGNPDGYFGNMTDTAVRNFQRKYGLTVDGIVGNGTLTKIDEALNVPKPIKNEDIKIIETKGGNKPMELTPTLWKIIEDTLRKEHAKEVLSSAEWAELAKSKKLTNDQATAVLYAIVSRNVVR